MKILIPVLYLVIIISKMHSLCFSYKVLSRSWSHASLESLGTRLGAMQAMHIQGLSRVISGASPCNHHSKKDLSVVVD